MSDVFAMKLTRPSACSPLSAESLASLFSERDEAGDLVFRTSDGRAVHAHCVIVAAAMNPVWRGALASRHSGGKSIKKGLPGKQILC